MTRKQPFNCVQCLWPFSLAPFPFEATFDYSFEVKQYYRSGACVRFQDSEGWRTAEARVMKIKAMPTLTIILIMGRMVIVMMTAGSGLTSAQ